MPSLWQEFKSFAFKGNMIELAVTDDGIGFDHTQHSGSGRGLRNLAARAREIGGQFEIVSSAGKGTRIAVVFSAIP